jgi:hypothetical protein
VTWHTEGFLLETARGNSNDAEPVVDFRRSNLVPKRNL